MDQGEEKGENGCNNKKKQLIHINQYQSFLVNFGFLNLHIFF